MYEGTDVRLTSEALKPDPPSRREMQHMAMFRPHVRRAALARRLAASR